MGVRDPLTTDDITALLAERSGWTGGTQQIEKAFRVDSYPPAAAWAQIVKDVAQAAIELEHHPDIDIRWDTLRFAMTTHTAGDVVTELDFLLADRIDEIAARHGAVSSSTTG